MCGRSRGSADSRDGNGIVEPMTGSGSKESWRVMISIQFFKNNFLLRAEDAGVRVSVHGALWEEGLAGHQHSLIYPGAFSQPLTPLRLFPLWKFPDKPRHLVIWRASGMCGLSEVGGVYAWKGLFYTWKGLLDAWKGPCKACRKAEVSLAQLGGVWSWKVGSHSWQGLSHTSRRDTPGCCARDEGYSTAGAELAQPEGCKAGR